MARPRKSLSMQTGHINSADIARRKYEESLIKGENNELYSVPAKLFRDATAKEEYKRILKELSSMEIVGNLNRNNMIMLANLWAEYCEFLRYEKKYKDEPKVLSALRDRESRIINKILQLEGKSGMTLDSRLNLAAAKAEENEQALSEEFGDI